MPVIEVILIALSVVASLAVLAQYIQVPYPLLLVLGGILLGIVPGVPRVTFQPELVFLLFVPPLVFSSSFRASWQELRSNGGEIAWLAIGLVLASMLVVALVAHVLIPGMTWPVAFVLGAVISDTDPTAVTAIAERLHLPRRIISLLEGESLGNDATSLVSYNMAIAAVVVGVFSLSNAVFEFFFAGIGGIVIGLLVAYVYTWLQRRLDNPSVEVTLTLLVPFAAYLPANYLGASGVLALVAAGLYTGQRDPAIRSSSTRLQARATWDTLVFVLNGLIFILLGLQWPSVLEGVANLAPLLLARDAAVITATVILVRIVWVVGSVWLVSLFRRGVRLPSEPLSWKSVPVVAWAGMRGATTLVVALAIPLTTNAGTPFPDRALIIFLTFFVIVATLVIQGLSLPSVIRRAELQEDGIELEVARTRAAAHAAAVRRIDELARDQQLPEEAARLRADHERFARHFALRADGDVDQTALQHAESVRQLRQELVEAERREIIAMHDRGEISDEAWRAVLRDLDLQEQEGE